MRLIVEICDERGLPAIINIHDVALAQSFVRRIIGLKSGEVVFDGAPNELTDAVLTRIYGEEDWSATIRAVDEDADEPMGEPDPDAEQQGPAEVLDRERMAGLS